MGSIGEENPFPLFIAWSALYLQTAYFLRSRGNTVVPLPMLSDCLAGTRTNYPALNFMGMLIPGTFTWKNLILKVTEISACKYLKHLFLEFNFFIMKKIKVYMEKLCGICLYGFISIIIFFPLFTFTGVYLCSYIDNVILRNTLENSDFILILTFHLQFLFFIVFYSALFS